MPKLRLSVTQPAADIIQSTAVETGITADGKSGWKINGVRAVWENGMLVAAGDYRLYAYVATVPGLLTAASPDLITQVGWGLQNTGGVAVAVPYEPIKEDIVSEDRITVQPNIYLTIQSQATAINNNVIFIVDYEVVKLTDIEVLRLLAGGA